MRRYAERCWRMKYFSKILAAFCALLLLSALTADAKNSGRLAGNIKSMSGSPLRNAIIKIFKEVQQNEIVLATRSDRRGFFQSAQLTPGTYFLEVSRQGYQPVTATKITIESGQTTSLNIILRDFIEYINNNEDPRNWDLETVLRSTSDRRLIFRDLPGVSSPVGDEKNSPFYRSGAMNIASSAPLGENYLFHPEASQNGVSTNFAFAEPIGSHSRMILSGQMDSGSGAFWRFRDTFNYRPDSNHDYRVSVGYGRMNGNNPGTGTIPAQLLSKESELRESGVQTLAFGLEGNTKFLDLFAVNYGFDYSRLHYRTSKSFINPSLQIVITPAEGWSIRTSLASRRANDSNTVVLPDGETLNLAESTLITMVGNQASMSQIRHTEIAAEKTIAQGTNLEVSVYQDRIKGSGLPLMITTITPLKQQSRIILLNEDISGQRGARLTLKQKITDNLSGSVAYVYGESTSIPEFNELVSSEYLNSRLADFMRQSGQHSITGSLSAAIPLTKTTLLAVLRWYTQNPLIPADWFSDRMDIGTKSANFEIRQAVPLPDIMRTEGQWDVWVDLRNVLNQGREILAVTDGEVILNRNPRSIRFGISLNFH
jgi:hypothetical protein